MVRIDVDLAAGAIAGIVTSILLHPIDLLKTRLQVQDGVIHKEFSGLRNAVSRTWQAEGLSGFYKGVAPACVGNGLSWGLYMFFYEQAKRRRLASRTNSSAGEPVARLGPGDHMLAAWEGGTITTLLTNPVWLVKTRLQLQLDASGPGAYRGAVDAVRSILREEGPAGLYRGLAPALLLVSHGMVQFAAYEELKLALGTPPGGSGEAGTLSVGPGFVAGAASKFIATLVTYPSQVVRSRLQQRGGAYAGVVDCVMRTARYVRFRMSRCALWHHRLPLSRRQEGLRGFYRGLVANALRVAPSGAVTLVAYEQARGLLSAGAGT